MTPAFYVWVREAQGDHLRYGPYTLQAAKAFARIGSQFGGPRVVTRGVRGPLFRVYIAGKRTFPAET